MKARLPTECSLYVNIKTARRFHFPRHPFRVIRPAVFLSVRKIGKRGRDNPRLGVIAGETANQIIIATGDNAVKPDIKRAWQYMTAVVVNVLSYQINAPRRITKYGVFAETENFPRFRQYCFFIVSPLMKKA